MSWFISWSVNERSAVLVKRSRARVPWLGGVTNVKFTPLSSTPYFAMSRTIAIFSLVTSVCLPSATTRGLRARISKFTGRFALKYICKEWVKCEEINNVERGQITISKWRQITASSFHINIASRTCTVRALIVICARRSCQRRADKKLDKRSRRYQVVILGQLFFLTFFLSISKDRVLLVRCAARKHAMRMVHLVIIFASCLWCMTC